MTGQHREGVDVQPRPQDEGPLVRAGVRQQQASRRRPVREHDVDVEGARAPPLAPLPSRRALGLPGQLPGRGGVEVAQQHGVEVVSLWHPAHRRGLVDR